MFEDNFKTALDFGTALSTLVALMENYTSDMPKILNISGDEVLSKYEIGLKIADKYGCSRDLIVPISMKNDTKIFTEKRANCTLLDNSAVKKTLGLKELNCISDGRGVLKTVREILNYREMVYSLIRQDLRGRYKGSVLGFFWTFLNPLLQLIVYTFVFSAIMKQGIEDFYLFLFVAFVPWLFFSTSVSGGARAVINRQDLVKKMYFPRQILPIAFVTGNFINMLFSFVIVFLALAVSGRGIAFDKLYFLIPTMIVEYVFALGITMLTAGLTVFLRDLEYILGIVTMAWMYITPIMYPESIVPEKYRVIFSLNPITPIIRCYRSVLYYKETPKLLDMGMSLLIALVILVVGNVVFGKVQRRFAEEL